MTTETPNTAATDSALKFQDPRSGDEPTQESGPINTLRDLVDFAGRLAAEIPEEERKTSRAVMVAYLDEVAAREPSRPPNQQAE